jgi:hypothetical protein
MKGRSLLIILILLLALVPVFYFNRWLQRVLKPREGAVRFFLFLFVNFLLIIVYTILIVGIVLRVIPH